jgi:AcrR family transcriptional regulator
LADGGEDYAAKRSELVRLAALVFQEKGYKAATLNDIAARFGTDRASLYYYVGGKEELFHECVKGILDENLAAAHAISRMRNTPARRKLELLVEVVLESYEANYPYMFVYIQEIMAHIIDADTPWANEMEVKTRALEKIFLKVINEGREAGDFRTDIPVTLAASALFGMLNWTHRWYEPGSRHTPASISAAFCAIFFEGYAEETA